ncbi:tol-pal system protein YbgF [uncultured Desulfuromonas sp.]|uniref:tol-pal system protein YbgF n=1 Tax=uncultured Desulfuromonas sp. TaxID=181013 RepID=UPI00261E648F|nr:tol-pal system protein YbgF [uncultured Desulfuromonas sp.]
MKTWMKGMLILALAGSLSGCATAQRADILERDLEEMKRRLATTERGVVTLREDQAGELSSRLDVLARSQADLLAGLDSLRVESQAQSGRFEDLVLEGNRLREELSLVRNDLNLKVTALEDRLVKLQSQKEVPVAPPSAPQTPEVLYESALEQIQKKRNYGRGRELLNEFLNSYPENELAVNAMYWVGEAYYGEKKYENAILQFQDVIQKYGAHPKAASALLKQGLAFHALGDVKNAKVILHKVVQTYPQSPEAQKAKKRLADWK